MPSRRAVLAAMGAAGTAGAVGAARVAGVRRPVSVDGEWYRAAYDSQRTGYGPERTGPGTGLTRRWSTPVPEGVHQSSPVLVGDGTFVVGADASGGDGPRAVRFLELDTASGAVRTDTVVTRYDGQYGIGAVVWDSLVYADGTFYLLAFDGVHALERDGTERWHRPVGGGPANSIQSTGHPVVVEDTVYVPTASTTSDTGAREGVYALDAGTGAVQWRYEVPDGVRGWTFPPAYHDGTLYYSLLENGVVALDAGEGSVEWERRLAVTGPATVAGGRVFASLDEPDSGIVALEMGSGAEAWRTTDDGSWLGRSVAIADDRVFHRQSLSDVVCRDAATGDRLWRYDASHTGLGTPAVTDGTVYVLARPESGGEAGLAALDAEGGEQTGFAATRYGSGGDASVALSSGLAVTTTATGTVEAFESCLAGAGGHCLH
ncbi:PQQ-binding-like beta-propeller repeat protein [Haloglomus litoreum]|uniref:outer membrane protein assembly factor BamB family protein n=1 Tax=Haloglomus litoreum TaxID=3034026 RepID=UPI0023E7C92A|nr:PQQ-binding-like beta-propeller repeat protein [Haloglomus sp. DT116]